MGVEELKKFGIGVSFENSKRILSRAFEMNKTINDMVYDGIFESRREADRRLNKMIFDLAEEKGVSIYDICFNFIPEYMHLPHIRSGCLEQRCEMETEVRLVPMPFDFEHGPGYWKGKYYNLKKKVQEIIDNKEI